MDEMVSKSESWKDYKPSHESIKNIIKAQINNLFDNQVVIGFYLKRINDECMYKEDGFSGIGEYAYQTYGIEKDRCSWLMRIADKFCKEGSPCLKDEWKPFSISKLRELTYLTDEQLKEVTPNTTVKVIRKMKPKKEKVATSQPKSDVTESKPGISIQVEENRSSGQCIHRTEFICTLSESSKLTTLNGENCSNSCCWNCNRHGACGYECNSSAHRPDMDNRLESVNENAEMIQKEPEIVIEIAENVIEETETVSEQDEITFPCDTCDWDIKGCCNYGSSKLDYCVNGDKWKAKINTESDIIQTEYTEPVQPELPILKNNDQRKNWAENYKAWGEWYHDENIDCHYYKFDFFNGDRLIVEEYLDRETYWGKENRDLHYFHLLQKEKPKYEKNNTYDKKYEHDTTSLSEIVEYLKELQKGRAK